MTPQLLIKDPLASLALTLVGNPGAFALLLGSGVSTGAHILSGWQITLDLVRQLALALGEETNDNPLAWFNNKYHKDPDYSDLLETIGKTEAERRSILETYFEPSELDRERGHKEPGKAHKAIAKLVKDGYIRIILTTNFDRLLELALASENIIPNVMSSTEAIKGSKPISHQEVFVIKLHGDYKDNTIKNTKKELSHYSAELKELLMNILDQFGLIVCGWSAEYDDALRKCIEECKSRRYSTFITVKGESSDAIKRLVSHKNGITIPIGDADQFFDQLYDKVNSLTALKTSDPLTVELGVSEVKRYLSQDEHIKLHDLVMNEAGRINEHIWNEQKLPIVVHNLTSTAIEERLIILETITDILLHMMITGCYFGRSKYNELWKNCLERIAYEGRAYINETTVPFHTFAFYPAVLLLYGAGIASILAKDYACLAALIQKSVFKSVMSEEAHTTIGQTKNFINYLIPQVIPQLESFKFTNHIFTKIRPAIINLGFSEADYKEAFQDFEILLAIAYSLATNGSQKSAWHPGGLSVSENRIASLNTKFNRYKHEWPPYKHGVFGEFHFDTVQIKFKQYFDYLITLRNPIAMT